MPLPFLNAGDVHKWVTGVFADSDYVEAHRLIRTSITQLNGVAMPAIWVGAIPVMNPDIREVAYVGLDPDTAIRRDMMRVTRWQRCGLLHSSRYGKF